MIISDEIANLTVRYLRNTDNRDHMGQVALFSDDAVVRVLADSGNGETLLHGPIVGGMAIAEASAALRSSVPAGRRTQHCTTDRLIAIDGARASIDAQFFVVHTDRIATGECTSRIVETGAYRFGFRQVGVAWLIASLDIIIDAPDLTGTSEILPVE